jgi:hypothetical protein
MSHVRSALTTGKAGCFGTETDGATSEATVYTTEEK